MLFMCQVGILYYFLLVENILFLRNVYRFCEFGINSPFLLQNESDFSIVRLDRFQNRMENISIDSERNLEYNNIRE